MSKKSTNINQSNCCGVCRHNNVCMYYKNEKVQNNLKELRNSLESVYFPDVSYEDLEYYMSMFLAQYCGQYVDVVTET